MLVQAGDTWTFSFGDPTRSGTLTTTLNFSYTDANGVKQDKSISAQVDLLPADSADTKKTKVQNALQGELDKPENQPNGAPLATLSGNGNVMTADPAAGNDTKITSAETTDSETGEDDKIIKPGKKGLAEIGLPGELLGTTSDGSSSVFFITTNAGQASVTLYPGMKKSLLLKNLRTGLLSLEPEADILIDLGRKVLYVILPEGEEGIVDIGAGTTDEGMDAFCKVMVTEE
jgi:hypothetical protein